MQSLNASLLLSLPQAIVSKIMNEAIDMHTNDKQKQDNIHFGARMRMFLLADKMKEMYADDENKIRYGDGFYIVSKGIEISVSKSSILGPYTLYNWRCEIYDRMGNLCTQKKDYIGVKTKRFNGVDIPGPAFNASRPGQYKNLKRYIATKADCILMAKNEAIISSCKRLFVN